MIENELEATYQRILAQSRHNGDLQAEAPGREQRRHPRIRVDPAQLPAELDPWVFAIDISISGMAFYADEPVEPGKAVPLTLGDMMTVTVEVLGCHEEPAAEPGGLPRYRLHCRFADEEAGMRLLVAIKEMEQGAQSA